MPVPMMPQSQPDHERLAQLDVLIAQERPRVKRKPQVVHFFHTVTELAPAAQVKVVNNFPPSGCEPRPMWPCFLCGTTAACGHRESELVLWWQTR